MINAKMVGLVMAAFVAGSFIASPELRAYAANTVDSSDIINNTIQSEDVKDGQIKAIDMAANSVTAGKIKDGEVKAAEIAADSIGGSELIGVSKFLFGSCPITLQDQVFIYTIECDFQGAEVNDRVMTSLEGDWTCGTNPVVLSSYISESNKVNVNLSGSTTCGDYELLSNMIVFRQ
jgi:hypothetical protein